MRQGKDMDEALEYPDLTELEDFEELLRLKSILAPEGPIPVSKSTWWAGVKDGRFPRSIKLSPRVTVWRSVEIKKLVDGTFEVTKCNL